MPTYYHEHQRETNDKDTVGWVSKRRLTDMVKGDPKVRTVGSLFLDSGAHSLYNNKVSGRYRAGDYSYFKTREFWAYVDGYAAFLKAHAPGIDYYVNVDVIYNPEMSWEVLKYLEKEHGLRPLPVIHCDTPMRWVHKHLDAGYEFLGVGGLGQGVTKAPFRRWADRLFTVLCPPPDHLPLVRTHGFAMTSHSLMLRWPWWSVDSASWAKAAAYGSVYVPHKRGDSFDFSVSPYTVAFSDKSPSQKVKGRHVKTFSAGERSIIYEWLERVDVPLGTVGADGETVEEGVINHYGTRAIANLRYFEAFVASMPPYPRPFRVSKLRTFFSH